MAGQETGRAGHRPLGRRWVLGLAVVLLAGCGGVAVTPATPPALPPTATATPDPALAAAQTATAVAFGTANAQHLAAMLTPIPATPSPSPDSSSTAAPAVTAATRVPSTTTLTPSPATAAAAGLASWPVGSAGGQYPARTTYDAASGAYTIALANPTQFYGYTVYDPSGSRFPDVRVDVDVRLAAGPGAGAYGVTCGAQGKAEQKPAGYNVLVHPDTQQFSVSWHPSEGQAQVIAPNTSLSAIKQGTAVNHLQVTCQGSKIAVVINSVTAGSYSVTQPTAGGIGLIVVAPPHPTGSVSLAASFAHLSVAPLP